MGTSLDREQLAVALEEADLRVLLMVLFHVSGDERWLEAPYLPRRDVRLIADEEAGFTPEIQGQIRRAAVDLLAAGDLCPAVPQPGEALLLRMMQACLGEQVSAEYAPMMLEQMGFRTLLQDAPELAAPVPEGTLPVLIVGAGVSGIVLGKFLLEQGIPFRIIEKNSQVGGTWWQNIYPGCGVDTPSHAYSFSFGPRYRWQRFFSPRDDIQDYLQQTAVEADLYPYIQFESSVQKADWNETKQCWQVSIDSAGGTELVESFALISAVGQLNLPWVPDLKGAAAFAGTIFHSSEWPAGLRVAGKRVAVVGTGASAMQIVPTIADEVAQLTIYQRSPQWARPIPRYHEHISAAAQWLIEEVPFYAAWLRFTMFWRYGDGLLPYLRKDPNWPHPERSMNRVNDKHRIEMLAHMETTLGDRADLLGKCVPAYPPYGKRILLDNGWFDTLLKPNVELVTQAIDHLDSQAVITSDGERRELDVLVLATGFQVGKMAARLNITGRNARKLSEDWAEDNPSAYLGITVAGFPNLFCMLGPNTGLGHGGSVMFQAEVQARYILESLVHLLNTGARSMEVAEAVQSAYVASVDAEHEQMIWTHPGLSTYYRNPKGRVFSLLPWRLVDYWQLTRHVEAGDYQFHP